MSYGLVCFDLDGTLVQNTFSSWQLFHHAFGIDESARKDLKEKYFQGKITYAEWATSDVELWKRKGAAKKDFEKAMSEANICLMPGTREALETLKKKGFKLAIISGSISILLEHLLPEYREIFDDVYISHLHFDEEGKISRVDPTDFDMEGKARALKIIAAREKLSLKQCVFIGDHRNDIEAAKEAGLSIAFDAKDDDLRKICKVCIDTKDVRDILPLILDSEHI